MAAMFLGTKTASDVDHDAQAIVKHDTTMEAFDLRQHSLNAVVGSNRWLWRSPRQWTQEHVRALCVDRQSDADTDESNRDKDSPSLHALIPAPTNLEHRIRIMALGGPPPLRANFLSTMLAFPEHIDVGVGVGGGPGPGPDTEAIPFTPWRDCVMDLAVGPRAYPLPLLYNFHLGPFVLSYLDSTQIDRPPYRGASSGGSDRPHEPCIVAILIAMAQRDASSTDEPAVKTRLIYTHRDDHQHADVYTARVSRPLLDRFRHPNRPPTTYPCSHTIPSLIKLQHTRVSYEPYDTFQRRILAAVSISATTMPLKIYRHPINRLKRKVLGGDDARDPKRQRQGDLRTP
ncbi:hypothetical protein F5Y10DRAFT_251879 [Nemania abortiva]|nr:hypothetical protein F5Y10DRAFT_251879 [Nemania abortiva]